MPLLIDFPMPFYGVWSRLSVRLFGPCLETLAMSPDRQIDGPNGCWVETLPYESATAEAREIFDAVRSPDGQVDPLYLSHSLRPYTVLASDMLYKSTLHGDDNLLPPWFLELVGAYTAALLACDYAAFHHGENFRRLAGDDARASDRLQAIKDDRPEQACEGKELALLRYARKLTLTPQEMLESDVEALRKAGASDGEIVEVNQVCASFNYYARVINGLGVRR